MCRWRGQFMGVHRIVFILLAGAIPEDMELDHVSARGCRYRDCCFPGHLEAVTHKVNMERSLVGRVNTARASARTHCKNGHEYTPENTKLKRYPQANSVARICITCQRGYDRKYNTK